MIYLITDLLLLLLDCVAMQKLHINKIQRRLTGDLKRAAEHETGLNCLRMNKSIG